MCVFDMLIDDKNNISNMEVVMKFNEKLIELRKSKGLSQDELGEKLQVSRQSISKWETGQSYPDFAKLVNISDYYGLSLDELVKGISVQDVRDKTSTENQVAEIYDDIQRVKSIGKSMSNSKTVIIVQKIIVGLGLFIGIAMILGFVLVLLGIR